MGKDNIQSPLFPKMPESIVTRICPYIREPTVVCFWKLDVEQANRSYKFKYQLSCFGAPACL